jgi:integrase
MAQGPVARVRKDGGVSYRVTFIEGGGAWRAGVPRASETFTDEQAALDFKQDVEAAGEHWPVNADGQRWLKGRGYPDPVKQAKARQADAWSTTFDEVASAYFTWSRAVLVEEARNKSVESWDRDHRTWELHLSPTFGKQAFASVDADSIDAWRRTQTTNGAAGKSLRNRHGLLSSIMAHGQMRMKLRGDNPCSVTILPRRKRNNQIMFFHPGEWKLFRACLRSDAHLLVDVKLATAVRWGEISAFRVGDCTVVDAETVHIYLVRAWSRRGKTNTTPIKYEEGETKAWLLKGPKSDRTRWVTVSGRVARDLIAHIDGRSDEEYIFLTDGGTPWRYQNFHTDRWQPALRVAAEVGMTKRLTPHMLRHTAVVWSLADGMDLYAVSAMLGHSNIQTTVDEYGALINLKDPKMARIMAQRMLESEEAIVPKKYSQAEIDALAIGRRDNRTSTERHAASRSRKTG